MTLTRVFFAGVLLSIGACDRIGPYDFLPKPYQPEGKGQNVLWAYNLENHIVVPHISGLEAETSLPLQKAVVAELAKRDIVGSLSRVPQNTFVFQGSIIQKGGHTDPRIIRWRMIDPNKQVAYVLETPAGYDLTNPNDESANLDAELARHIADKIASRTVGHISGVPSRTSKPTAISRPPEVTPPQTKEELLTSRPKFYVLPVLGAPGDGNKSLRAAVEETLAHNDMTVVPNPASNAVRLQCVMTLDPLTGGQDLVRLRWEVKTSDGRVLASMEQENTIPRNSLAGPWGETAYIIAAGAVDGVLTLLSELGD